MVGSDFGTPEHDPSSQQTSVKDQGVETTPIPDIKVVQEDQELIGGLDPNTLDPNMHYRFVYTGGNKIARRLTRGYRFVRPSTDSVQKLYSEGNEEGDDTIRHGDTVLMCIAKAKHEEMEERVRNISRARLSAPKGQFRKKAKGLGIEVNDKKE